MFSLHSPQASGPGPTRANVGFELAKASQRWNGLLQAEFQRRGFDEVRASYGSLLLPLFEEDGLRMGELAARARLTKQTMTTMVRLMEQAGLVEREADPDDGRATLINLTPRAREFAPVAAEVVSKLERQVMELLGRDGYRVLRGGLRALMELDDERRRNDDLHGDTGNDTGAGDRAVLAPLERA
jgi:DNA-binding MarR family transcriptional regulator